MDEEDGVELDEGVEGDGSRVVPLFAPSQRYAAIFPQQAVRDFASAPASAFLPRLACSTGALAAVTRQRDNASVGHSAERRSHSSFVHCSFLRSACCSILKDGRDNSLTCWTRSSWRPASRGTGRVRPPLPAHASPQPSPIPFGLFADAFPNYAVGTSVWLFAPELLDLWRHPPEDRAFARLASWSFVVFELSQIRATGQMGRYVFFGAWLTGASQSFRRCSASEAEMRFKLAGDVLQLLGLIISHTALITQIILYSYVSLSNLALFAVLTPPSLARLVFSSEVCV